MILTHNLAQNRSLMIQYIKINFMECLHDRRTHHLNQKVTMLPLPSQTNLNQDVNQRSQPLKILSMTENIKRQHLHPSQIRGVHQNLILRVPHLNHDVNLEILILSLCLAWSQTLTKIKVNKSQMLVLVIRPVRNQEFKLHHLQALSPEAQNPPEHLLAPTPTIPTETQVIATPTETTLTLLEIKIRTKAPTRLLDPRL
jgi:hypothetical protein